MNNTGEAVAITGHYFYENDILHEIIDELLDTMDMTQKHKGLSREEKRHLVKLTMLKALEEGRIMLNNSPPLKS